MRSHLRNSPEAAARIVALVMIADGHVCRSELDVLNQLQLERELGLPVGGFAQVVQTLCEDQLLSVYAGGPPAERIGEETLASFMAEVDDSDLQRRVLRLACAAAEADRHLADAERVVLEAALRHWGRFDAAGNRAVIAAVDPILATTMAASQQPCPQAA